LGTSYVVATPVAFAAGAVNGYVSDRGWTFGARAIRPARECSTPVQVTGALSTSLLVPLFIAAGFGKLSA
jgi:putative flippase GtrA